MNPSPTDILELFTFVAVTLVQYATVTGHLPGVSAANAKVKGKKVNKVEVAQDESPKEDHRSTQPRQDQRARDRTGTIHRVLRRMRLRLARPSLWDKAVETEK